MFGWLSSFWSDPVSGPARNAPNQGIGIKQVLEQRPINVIFVGQDVIEATRRRLKPTKINEIPPLSNKPPIMTEFDEVFSQGHAAYFANLRRRRLEAASTSKLSSSDESANWDSETEGCSCSSEWSEDGSDWSSEEESDSSSDSGRLCRSEEVAPLPDKLEPSFEALSE